MTPAILVADLRARGVTLEPRGDRLAVRPASRLTLEERETLQRHKAEVLALLRYDRSVRIDARPVDSGELARVLELPLGRLDRVLELRVPWWPLTLWFCPTEADAKVLVAEGISRARIWTRSELLDLLLIPSITKPGAHTVALAKLEFDGEVTDVRKVWRP